MEDFDPEEFKSLAADVAELKTLARAARWVVGLTAASAIALGAWQVRTTLLLEERQAATTAAIERHEAMPGHEAVRDGIAAINARLAAIQAAQAAEQTAAREARAAQDARLERIEERLRARRR